MTTLLEQRRTLDRLRDAGAMDTSEYEAASAALNAVVEDAEVVTIAGRRADTGPPLPDLRPAALAALAVSLLLMILGMPLAFALPLGLAVSVGVLLRELMHERPSELATGAPRKLPADDPEGRAW